MALDPAAERIHAALGLPPPTEQQPPRRRVDPVVKLARLLDAAAQDWLDGRSASINALERALPKYTPQQITEAHQLLHIADGERRERR